MRECLGGVQESRGVEGLGGWAFGGRLELDLDINMNMGERDREMSESHRGMVCSRCCVEKGADGDVFCLGCLRAEEAEVGRTMDGS